MLKKRLAILAMVAMIAPLILAACGPTPTPQIIKETSVVVQTVVVEKAGTPIVQEATKIVEVEKVVTATPEPPKPVKFVAPRPDTYTLVTFGDIDTLDPNLAYDTASAAVIMNVMEGLIFFNREKMTEYIPVLATEVPSVENGGISADGLTYTFKIRQGVKFHNGNDLTPSDFEYTFERGLLNPAPTARSGC